MVSSEDGLRCLHDEIQVITEYLLKRVTRARSCSEIELLQSMQVEGVIKRKFAAKSEGSIMRLSKIDVWAMKGGDGNG